MTLTKREKFLLFIMALVAMIMLIFVLVLLPLRTEMDLLTIEKESLESQKTVIDARLPSLAGLKSKQDLLVKDINNELSRIESPITGAEFERWVLPLTTKYDMQITDVSISQTVVAEPSGNVVLVNEPIYGLKTMIQGFTGDIDQIDTAPVSASNLLKMTVKYDVVTNYTRFKSILNQITLWGTTFFITDADYNFENGVASFTFDAYTIHKISYVGDRGYNGDYHAIGDNDPPGDPGFVGNEIAK